MWTGNMNNDLARVAFFVSEVTGMTHMEVLHFITNMTEGRVLGRQQTRTTLILACILWVGGDALTESVKQALQRNIYPPDIEKLEAKLYKNDVEFADLKEKALRYKEGHDVVIQQVAIPHTINAKDAHLFVSIASCSRNWKDCDCPIAYPIYSLHGDDKCHCIICGMPCAWGEGRECHRIKSIWRRILDPTAIKLR